MFAQSERQEHFRIYTFGDGQGTQMEVVPDRGGLVSRLCLQGEEIFYLDESTLIDETKNVRGGNPVLFPICGPSGKGFRQHGFARNYPWQVIATGVNEERAWITLEFKQQEQSFEVYPYHFVLRFTYVLTQQSLRIEQSYKNTGHKEMPFHAGFHPYFTASSKQHLDLQIETDSVFDLLKGQEHPFTGQLNYDDEAEYNYVFGPLAVHECTFQGHHLGRRIRLKFDQPFKYIVFWSLPQRPFICVEPWMAGNRSFETGEDLQWLPPHSELKTVVEYEMVD